MIFRHAKHHEVARAVPIRFAELPEGRPDGVETGGRHVHRAKATVGRVVRRPELGGPPGRQRLALVAPSEEGQFAGVRAAHLTEPIDGYSERLLPFDLLELGGTAFAHPLERLGQLGRRMLLHDPGRTLGTQDTLVHRMITIALDVADTAVQQVNLNPAAAGAHVTGGFLDLVGNLRRQLDLWLRHIHSRPRSLPAAPTPR